MPPVTPRLVVVTGAANTGKLAATWEIAASDPQLRVLHRDQVRVLLGRLIDEWHLTLLIAAMAEQLLRLGYSVITAGQNLAESDVELWSNVAAKASAELQWKVCT